MSDPATGDHSHPIGETLLDDVHRRSFDFFLEEVNPDNGLVRDGTVPESPASIAAVGFALAGYPVAVERGWMARDDARARTLAALRFFHEAPHDGAPDGTGHKGFYYHFLDMETGRRAWQSELSTIDTTLLLAGALVAAQYFDEDGEAEVRHLAGALYRRADWIWATNGGPAVTHGWKPEKGFIRHRWHGYDEALLLYVLGLGSPTHPLPDGCFDAYTRTYRWKKIYGHEYLYAGPLFIHQFSHLWVDFRGIQDAFMRDKGIDYFENSRRATYVQQEYAKRNPKGFKGYSAEIWGVTASDGPGPATERVGGRSRRFFGYKARGVPFGPDDGTIAPWAAIASLPFAPEIVTTCIHCLSHAHAGRDDSYGFENAFNPTFPDGDPELGWVSPHHFALNQGPITLAVANYRDGLVWRLMRACPPVVRGLRRAGFAGGWLDGAP